MQQITKNDVPNILGRTELNAQQENLLTTYFGNNEEKKRAARLDYHLDKLQNTDKEFRDNYLSHAFNRDKVHEELTDAGQKETLTEDQKHWVRKMGVDENAARNTRADRDNEGQREKLEKNNQMVWDNRRQEYVKKD